MRKLQYSSVFLLLSGLLAATPAHADDYPSRPVHIMVGFIPGSAADITARVLANGLGKLLGQLALVLDLALLGLAPLCFAAALGGVELRQVTASQSCLLVLGHVEVQETLQYLGGQCRTVPEQLGDHLMQM